MGQIELQSRVEASQSSYLDQGVTFDIGGEERAVEQEPREGREGGQARPQGRGQGRQVARFGRVSARPPELGWQEAKKGKS